MPRDSATQRALSCVEPLHVRRRFRSRSPRSPPRSLPFTLFETRRLDRRGRRNLRAQSPPGASAGASAGRSLGLLRSSCSATCPLYVRATCFMNARGFASFAVAMALLLLGLVRAFEQYPRRVRSRPAALGGRPRPGVRLAHHGRHSSALDALRGSSRSDLAGRGPRATACARPSCAGVSRALVLGDAACAYSPIGDGAGLAVVGRRPAQSVSRGRIFLAFLRAAVARAFGDS